MKRVQKLHSCSECIFLKDSSNPRCGAFFPYSAISASEYHVRPHWCPFVKPAVNGYVSPF